MTARMMLEEPVSYILCSMSLPHLPEPPQLPLQRARDVDLEKAFGFTRHAAIDRPFRARCACVAVHGGSMRSIRRDRGDTAQRERRLDGRCRGDVDAGDSALQVDNAGLAELLRVREHAAAS